MVHLHCSYEPVWQRAINTPLSGISCESVVISLLLIPVFCSLWQRGRTSSRMKRNPTDQEILDETAICSPEAAFLFALNYA
jgi:hypothetical protein